MTAATDLEWPSSVRARANPGDGIGVGKRRDDVPREETRVLGPPRPVRPPRRLITQCESVPYFSDATFLGFFHSVKSCREPTREYLFTIKPIEKP